MNATELENAIKVTQTNLNDLFFVMATILTFAMQAGFSLIEVGLVRTKHVTHVLIETTLDAFIGASVYWFFGYAFAYGEGNVFIGWNGFALSGVPSSLWSFWLFQLIFANTASTIVSGAIAERATMPAFLICSVLFTGVMYPIASRWIWYEHGWLKGLGFIDHGGSGVVHMLGGVCSLVATVFVGSRIGRFHTKDCSSEKTDMPAHSITVVGTGGFLLLFGFLGYNMITELSLTKEGDGSLAALCALNTLLAGSSGAIVALIFGRFTSSGKYKWSYLTMLNGTISGMVAACSGCNVYAPWAAYVVGGIAGYVFFALRSFLHKMKVDDILDAFPVHFGGGFVGLLGAALLGKDGLLIKADQQSAIVFGHQLIGTATLIIWGTAFTAVIFSFLKYFQILRVSPAIEMKGMDSECCAEFAYPAESWEENQYLEYQNRRALGFLQLFKEAKDSCDICSVKGAPPMFMNGINKDPDLLELIDVLNEVLATRNSKSVTTAF